MGTGVLENETGLWKIDVHEFPPLEHFDEARKRLDEISQDHVDFLLE